MEMIVATLVLIVDDGKLLLGRKIRKGADIGEDTLNGPGGKVDPGQTILECLITEVKDEVGLDIREEDAKERAVITFHNGDRITFRVHVFVVTTYTGVPTSSPEMVEPDTGWWYSLDAIPFDRMLASDREWILRAINGEQFRAEVFQTSDGKELTRPIEYVPY